MILSLSHAIDTIAFEKLLTELKTYDNLTVHVNHTPKITI